MDVDSRKRPYFLEAWQRLLAKADNANL